jgi:hypothetical protein
MVAHSETGISAQGLMVPVQAAAVPASACQEQPSSWPQLLSVFAEHG